MKSRALLVAAIFGFTFSLFSIDSSIKTLKVDRGLTVEAKKCVECHAEKQPGIVADWKESRHAHVGVSCLDCHSVDKGSKMASQSCPGVKGTDTFMSVMVSPNTCSRCHANEVNQFNESGHYRAALQYQDPEGRNFKSMSMLISYHEGQNMEEFKTTSDQAGCMQCHGSIIKMDKDNKPTKETWPSAGMGTVYPDGGVGNCTVCHTRHGFNIAEARKPVACASCHLGPDHPDIEIFNNSKHGHIYNSEGTTWNFDSAPGAWEPGDYRGPTCATCHQSGIGDLETTHNVSERLKWNLWAKVSKVRNSPDPLGMWTGNGPEGRKKMEKVCSNCHTSRHTKNFFAQADENIELYNKGYWAPAKKMKEELAAKNLLKKNPWDDKFQKILYHLWHHEGRRMRQGAAMAAPDYAHWHGVFELQQDLYELKSIYKKRMETGKIED
ncbi:MAG: beta-ketoacyl-ACP synthase [Candidatus Cloacimonadota bacterium]|nr:MAG: beta-ketoacyl-ACP synthase [Candidatus Cloacimonadota bacterium]PIE77983.1 MAG: beta-ketoacyl-ACP synthase [Candidatus Delongbacteria bacterium]